MRFSDFAVLIISVSFIVIGCLSKNFFYATGITYASTPSKRAPIWIGRVAFIGIGLLMLVPELMHLSAR